jgi:acyl-CoA thioesterase-1
MIDVLNRGMSGQEATSEMPRLDPDVIAEAPALVIWQVGTNAVFYPGVYNFDEVSASIEAGIDWLAAFPIDVVLMDLQYTTAVVQGDRLAASKGMVARIAAVAEKKRVNLFPRFALMQRWCEQGIKIEDLIDAEDTTDLHMSDWATICVTKALDGAIADALDLTG